MIPTAYELKRLVARQRHRFWCSDALAGLPTSPVYLFHNQEAFDSDPVDMVARHLSAGPLRLPHREVLFEVTNRGPDVSALVAFMQTTGEGALTGFLFMRDRRTKVGWTDALCIAEFLAAGGAKCRANYQIANDEAKVYFEVLVWMVWRSLAILGHAAVVQENRLSLPQRSKMSARGVSGWIYRVVDIDPQQPGWTRKDRNPRQPALACPPRPLAHASRRPEDLRARVRGRRCRDGRGGQGLSGADGGERMSDITPSDTQARAIAAIKDWFENRTHEQQVFRLFGYAGSGKSTVLRFALDELGLEPHRGDRDGDACVPGVVTATFTGKAALVLRRKGTPARTIHSLIYSVIEATEDEIAAAQKKIEQAETEARRLSGFDRTSADAAIEAMRQAVAGMKKPRFALNPQSDAAHAKLIVLNEVSMVGEEMARDLMSFGKPILVLGDPGQLPPIKGEGAFTKDAPDIMLTEIHRQAAESAIIRLATLARQGQPIGFGQHDTFVWKMRKADVTPHQCLRGGQVICGMNATRLQLNNGMRRAAGFADAGYLPTEKAEKIICLKNQNDLGLINGMFLSLDDIVDEGSLYFSAIVTDEDGHPIGPPAGNGARGRLRIYKGHFEDHVAFDKNRHDRDWKDKRNLTEATFGWAITGHKSQGSSWPNVIVWDDGLGRSEQDRRRWLYTVITRAEKGLVILA